MHNNPVNLVDPFGLSAAYGRDNPIEVNVEGVEEGKTFAWGTAAEQGDYAPGTFDQMTADKPVLRQSSNGITAGMGNSIGEIGGETREAAGKIKNGGLGDAGTGKGPESSMADKGLQAGMMAGAAMTGADIRTDGTGSPMGIPGGQCMSCTGGRAWQAAFIGLTVGATIAGSAWAGYRALQATASPYTIVSSWADRGITPDLSAGRWVMRGLPTRGNFFRSGLSGPKMVNGRYQSSRADINNVITDAVLASDLRLPPMLWRGMFGQRIYRP